MEADSVLRKRKTTPKMDRRDSSLVSAMKSVMKLGRANRPKMPSIMRKAEGI